MALDSSHHIYGVSFFCKDLKNQFRFSIEIKFEKKSWNSLFINYQSFKWENVFLGAFWVSQTFCELLFHFPIFICSFVRNIVEIYVYVVYFQFFQSWIPGNGKSTEFSSKRISKNLRLQYFSDEEFSCYLAWFKDKRSSSSMKLFIRK